MAFAEGDTVVHPRHGVATVRGKSTRGTGADSTSYLELSFERDSLQIMVPEDAVDEIGIRRLSTKQEATAIMAVLEAPSDVPAVWQERNASTLARIRSSELAQAAMVIRDLTRHARRTGKPLSSAENALLQACIDTVASELSLALGLSEDDTRTLVAEKVAAGADGD